MSLATCLEFYYVIGGPKIIFYFFIWVLFGFLLFLYLDAFRRFKHCKGHIHVVGPIFVLIKCKLLTIGKKLTTSPHRVRGLNL